jgi:hypothetical protein
VRYSPESVVAARETYLLSLFFKTLSSTAPTKRKIELYRSCSHKHIYLGVTNSQLREDFARVFP